MAAPADRCAPLPGARLQISVWGNLASQIFSEYSQCISASSINEEGYIEEQLPTKGWNSRRDILSVSTGNIVRSHARN